MIIENEQGHFIPFKDLPVCQQFYWNKKIYCKLFEKVSRTITGTSEIPYNACRIDDCYLVTISPETSIQAGKITKAIWRPYHG